MSAVSEERTTPADITAAAVASFDGADDARLRELMQASSATYMASPPRWG